MTTRGRQRRLRVAARSVLVGAGLVVLGLIAFVAILRLAAMLDLAWSRFPELVATRHAVPVAGYLALATGAVLAVSRSSRSTLMRWSPLVPMAALVAVRVAAMPLVATPLPPDSDPLVLHRLAVDALDGANWLVTHRPMGFSAMVAALYAVFGVHPWLVELLNLVFATVAGWMIYRLARAAWGLRPATAAVTLYALMPSQLLLVTTVHTEVVYSALLVAAIAVAAGAVRAGRVWLAAGAGALLALSQYVRPLSQAFLATFLAVPFIGLLRPRRATALAAALTIAFVVVLVPILVHNVRSHGAVSFSTSSYGGWSVFVGANQEHDGRFNTDDQAVLRAMDEPSTWERSEILGRAGLQRIAADPSGFASLALRKFRIMWGDDAYGGAAALSGSKASASLRTAVAIGSQAMYAALTAAAALGLWRVRRRPPVAALLVVGIVVTVAVIHTFIEVQARYHAYVVPLLCFLAAAAVVGPGRLGMYRGRTGE